MDELRAKNNELLEEQIQRQLNYLNSAPCGSEEAKAIIDDLTELSKIAAEQTKLSLDSLKIQNDYELEQKKLEQANEKQAEEFEAKERDRNEEAKKRRGDHVLQAVGIGVPIIVTVAGNLFANWQLGKLLKFESTGEWITSAGGKTWLGSLFRKK